MASTVASVNTAHTDMIHDAQMDYYGKKLATCSSDRTIKIFQVEGDEHHLVKELLGHDGPVWQVAWAHPKFGNLLASCSYDRKVIVWKETQAGWEKVKEHTAHDSSVNSIAWAPHELGYPMLACGSSDGDVSLLLCNEGVWSTQRIAKAHAAGVTSVSWAPITPPTPGNQPLVRLVSGGCDNLARVWRMDRDDWSRVPEELAPHSDWVRDVAWAPVLATSMVATCTQDGQVAIWTQEADVSSEWQCKILNKFAGPVWRVSWSVTGTILAVSTADNKVTLWKQSLTGEWNCVNEIEDSAARM